MIDIGSKSLRVAYLLLTSGRPLSSKELAEMVDIKSTSNLLRIIDNIEMAGFVTEITHKPYRGRMGYINYYSARLNDED